LKPASLHVGSGDPLNMAAGRMPVQTVVLVAACVFSDQVPPPFFCFSLFFVSVANLAPVAAFTSCNALDEFELSSQPVAAFRDVEAIMPVFRIAACPL
jgi:hypothetical protein